jgi:prepilin-type N-terminal cleavage/methylation domain-containing protein
MKKGFTLIELITVIILLGVVGFIVLPAVNSMIKESKESLYEEQLEEIKLASEKWAYKNTELLPTKEGESITLTLLELKRSGNLPVDIKNPKTGELLSNGLSIVITYKENTYEYEIKEDITNTKISDNSPSLILNGQAIEYVEINSDYVEKGAVAKDKNENELSDIIITYYDSEKQVASIDSSLLKTYTVEYRVTDTLENLTTVVTRTVIVKDTTKPNIVVPSKITISESEASNYDLLKDVIVTDNSNEEITPSVSGFDSTIGEKIVSYTACDSSNNCNVVNRIIVVE